MSIVKFDIVIVEQWCVVREVLFQCEKVHICVRDVLVVERCCMLMIRVEKDYCFIVLGGGDVRLFDFFDGSCQFVVYWFFMDLDMDVYLECGCFGCLMYVD